MHIIKPALVVLLFLVSFTGIQAQYTLSVDIKGLRKASGCLYFSVFKTEDGFPDSKDKCFKKGKIMQLKSVTANYTFSDLPAGTYAVSIFHDENCDTEMKTNALGIPLEGTGASNDARGRFGPPKFADAKFTLSADKKITINMWYF